MKKQKKKKKLRKKQKKKKKKKNSRADNRFERDVTMSLAFFFHFFESNTTRKYI